MAKKKREKEIEEQLKELHLKPTDRLFRASETISGGPRVRKDQVINMHMDTIHECLTMLPPNLELHYRQAGEYIK